MRRTIVIAALLVTALSAAGKQRFSYIYARTGSNNDSISRGSLDEILRVRKHFSGTYVWARRDGVEYLIRDAAAIDEVARAFVPLEALKPDLRALHRRMKPFERKQALLEREIDALTDNEDDEAMSPNDRARLRSLQSELRGVEREVREYEREAERLDRRQDELEKVFDAEVERIVERAIRNSTADRVK